MTTLAIRTTSMMNCSTLINDADKWIIYSRASKHMVHILCMLTENIPLKYSQRNKVHLPNSILAHFSHIGSSQVLGGTEISNVLHIVEFHYNLPFVSKLTRELNCCNHFYPNFLGPL